MTDPIAYILLPDEWASKARCPLCNASPLAVVHHAEAVDQMACPLCHTLFEIEKNGPHIHFTALPRIFNGVLGGRWVTYAEVKQTARLIAAQIVVDNTAGAVTADLSSQKEPAPPEPPPFTGEMLEMTIPGSQVEGQAEEKPDPLLTPPNRPEPVYPGRVPEIKDVHTRAQDLYALGNRPEQIKEILSRDPALEMAEIQAAVDGLSDLKVAKKRRQRTILWVSIVIELVVILVCGAIISVWRPLLGVVGGDPGKQFVATLSANQTIAPLVGTPFVRQETEGPSPRPSCPQTKEQAAALFGGPSVSWISDVKDASWFFVTSSPVSIHIPGGMSVIVVDIGSAGVNTIPGPASIINTKSVTILCR